MDSVATDREQKLHEAMVELDKALVKLSAHDAAFMAPRVALEPATPAEIAAAQKASREASPRWQAEQKITSDRRGPFRYRNYHVYYYKNHVAGLGDWCFQHLDYDGAPDGPGTSCSDHRCGYAETPTEAKAEIDAQYEDLGLDENGHYK